MRAQRETHLGPAVGAAANRTLTNLAEAARLTQVGSGRYDDSDASDSRRAVASRRSVGLPVFVSTLPRIQKNRPPPQG